MSNEKDQATGTTWGGSGYMSDEFYDDSGGVIVLDPVTSDTTPYDDTQDILDYWTNHTSDSNMTGDSDWDGDPFNLDNIDRDGSYTFTGNPTAPTSNGPPAVPPVTPPNQANNSPRPTTTPTAGGSSGGASGGSSGSSSATSEIGNLIKSLGNLINTIFNKPAVTPGTTPQQTSTVNGSGVSPAVILVGAGIIGAALYFRKR